MSEVHNVTTVSVENQIYRGKIYDDKLGIF